jgi:predicted CopG family antitoxin
MADTSKNVNFRINKKDIAPVAFSVIARVINRNHTEISEDLKDLQELLNNDSDNVKEILRKMNSLVDIYEQIIDELNDSSELVLALLPPKPNPLEALGISFESPSDTEVLEDLPDLKEDSLGVDSGSE